MCAGNSGPPDTTGLPPMPKQEFPTEAPANLGAKLYPASAPAPAKIPDKPEDQPMSAARKHAVTGGAADGQLRSP